MPEPESDTPTRPSLQAIEQWLSPERFRTYLTVCEGNPDTALALYEWNMALGQVLLRDIAYFEIALRNVYDTTMRQYWPGECWLRDTNSPVIRLIMRRNVNGNTVDINRLSRKQIITAERVAGSSEHSLIVSNLMLGFWTHMTDTSHERDLWIPMLHHAWPRKTSRKTLHGQIQLINALRNRVAHHEHLFNPTSDAKLLPTAVDTSMITLFRQLCPGMGRWLYPLDGATPLTQFLEESPAPVAVRV